MTYTILALFTSGLHPVSSDIYANCLSVLVRPGCTRIQLAIGLICTWDVCVCVCVCVCFLSGIVLTL